MNPLLKSPSLAATMLGALPVVTSADQALDEWIAKIKHKDNSVRGPAWQAAPRYGAPAVKPLVSVMSDPDFEVARAAKRALWKIVRQAGRPGAATEAESVADEIVASLEAHPTTTRRELLWMLSEIGGERAIPAIAALLHAPDVREDARAALERIPTGKSREALEAALSQVAVEFRPAIAQSLRVRGVEVKEYPSQKLAPTRPAATSG